MNRRHALCTLGALGLSSFSMGKKLAYAQPSINYPNHPVRVLVGTAPGGLTDHLARLFAQHLAEATSQSFVVENRGGASGTLAAAAAARAPADGYTLLATTPTVSVVAPHLYKDLSFAPSVDLQPVCLLGAGPMILAVNADLPVKNVSELIALARTKPGDFAFATGGLGSNAHLTGELFASKAELKLVPVPYKGDGQAVIDVVSGQVPMMFSVISVLGPHIKSGRLRALAVASDSRMKLEPQVPTFKEAGLPGVDSFAWVAIYAPRSTPQAIITSLNDHWQSARSKPELIKNIASLSMDQVDIKTPAELTAFQKNEVLRWGKVIKDSGIGQE